MADLGKALAAFGCKLGRPGDEQYIRDICYEMKEGQRIRFAREFFGNAFTFGFPTIYNSPEEAFLSGMIGSGFGTFRVHRLWDSGDYEVSRHPESDKRYYVDPDRAHLFKRLADGTLERLSDTQYDRPREANTSPTPLQAKE